MSWVCHYITSLFVYHSKSLFDTVCFQVYDEILFVLWLLIIYEENFVHVKTLKSTVALIAK